jgi:hypothetical protein
MFDLDLRPRRARGCLMPCLAVIAVIALALAVPGTARAATTSDELDALARTLEANPANNATLNSQLLALLREPAKTLDGVTLPTTPAQYTNLVDTALKLRPKGWLAGATEQLPAASMGVSCTARLDLWVLDAQPGLRAEVFAWGKGNCPSVLSAAIARAWAYKLRQVGR